MLKETQKKGTVKELLHMDASNRNLREQKCSQFIIEIKPFATQVSASDQFLEGIYAGQHILI